MQAIVIFTDQFGSLVHAQEKKIDSKDAQNFKDSIDKIFQKLDQVKDDPSLPGYIYYSIINLIEKRKNNYQMSKYEEYIVKSGDTLYSIALNNNVSVDDAIRSEQAVKRDVLCIYSNDFLTHWKNSEFIVPEMIESRYIKNTSKGDHRVTWVFYRGDRSTMSNNLFMCEALRLFTSKVESGSDGYQIVELDNILSRNSSFTGVRNNRVSNKYSNNDDVY